jgi:hypothetical protein
LRWGFSGTIPKKSYTHLNHQPKGTGKDKGLGEEVHVEVGTAPYFVFGHVVFVLLELLLISFEVLDHEVLAHKLVVVGEVVDDLTVIKSDS